MSYQNPPALSYHFNRLQNKVIFITGVSSGIGEASARLFVKEGASVVISARRLDRLDAIATQLKNEGYKVASIECDVTNEESVQRAVDFTITTFGRIDGAFNNAGAGPVMGPLHTLKMSDFDRILTINLRGVFMCMKYEIQAMLKAGHGTIVNTSSGAGLVGVPRNSIYSASKFGLAAITKSTGLEYAKQGIRVNAIAPGATMTEGLEKICPDDESKARMAGMFPMNYIADPDDVARAALFLLSEESRWTTGHILPCEGGRTVG